MFPRFIYTVACVEKRFQRDGRHTLDRCRSCRRFAGVYSEKIPANVKKPKACANGSGERIQYVFECLFVQQTNCIFGLEPRLRVFRLGFWADRVFHTRPFTPTPQTRCRGVDQRGLYALADDRLCTTSCAVQRQWGEFRIRLFTGFKCKKYRSSAPDRENDCGLPSPFVSWSWESQILRVDIRRNLTKFFFKNLGVQFLLILNQLIHRK